MMSLICKTLKTRFRS